MKFTCVLKRFIPFAAALTLGLFVASFFVTIGAPRLRSGHTKHRHSHREMKMENQRLRQENEMLRQRLAELDENPAATEHTFRFERPVAVPPTAPVAPVPVPKQ